MSAYLNTKTTLVQKGFDETQILRQQEKDLYTIFASNDAADGYESAAEIGRAYKGYARASMEYFGVMEGLTQNMMQDVENQTNAGDMLSLFKQYTTQCTGVNDMILAQNKALQNAEWAVKQDEIQSAQSAWNKKVASTLNRGLRQWDQMQRRFEQERKKAQKKADEQFEADEKKWADDWQNMQAKKTEWKQKLLTQTTAENVSENHGRAAE